MFQTPSSKCILLLIGWLLAVGVTTGCESAPRIHTDNKDDDNNSQDNDETDDNQNDEDDGFDDDDDNNENDSEDTDTNDLSGCDGVDFIFVIDDSGSMADEQTNLIQSFPGFIEAIINSLELDNFHIMVVDSDDFYGMSAKTTCSPAPCCKEMCEFAFPGLMCAEDNGPFKFCTEWNGETASCDHVLGAGHLGQNLAANCQIEGTQRYLMEEQSDLDQTFACIAKVGTEGNGYEKLMEAMVQAVGPLAADGECNAGFLRENAVLVVTFITDENEECTEHGEECSTGNPAQWKQALVDAVGGREKNIVTIGVFGDNDLNNGICQAMDEEGNGAEPAPVLREFLGLFDEKRQHFCSVCLPDYSECFLEAVSIIDNTCEDIIVE